MSSIITYHVRHVSDDNDGGWLSPSMSLNVCRSWARKVDCARVVVRIDGDPDDYSVQ